MAGPGLQFEYKLFMAVIGSTLPWIFLTANRTDTAEKEILDRWGMKGH